MSCPCAPTAAAAACHAQQVLVGDLAHSCVHEATDPAQVQVLGTHCAQAALAAERGLVLVSRSASGSPVCTGGDSYHAFAQATDSHFGSLSVPMAQERQPHLYWVSLAATAAIPGSSRRYSLTISMVETQHRGLQRNEGRGPLRWSAPAVDESPLEDFLRYRRCAWQPVPVPAAVQVVEVAGVESAAAEPQCRAVAGLAPMAYVAATGANGCAGGLCLGDAHERLINTSNDKRLALRTRKGFAHVLKPVGCRYRWYDEADLTRCLAGRAVLNMGSALATDISKGLARINRTLREWTHRRPSNDQRRPLAQRLPQVADFHYQFERTGGFWHQDVMVGRSEFGKARVTTMLLDHPANFGLLNVLEPRTVQQAEARVGFRSAAEYEKMMCSHDVLLFESGVHDFGLPFTEWVKPSRSKLAAECEGRPAAECRAALAAALNNQSWRERPLQAYRERLGRLLAMWGRCRAQRPGFRAYFKLAPAPRARGPLAAGAGKGSRRGRALGERQALSNDCEAAQWGYWTQAHHVAVFNEVARAAVTAAGFAVFDPFGVTLHALPRWFDDARLIRHSIVEAEALSDLTTQLWLNQLCSP